MKILVLKSTTNKINNSPEGLNRGFELEEERLSKHKDKLIVIMQSKEHRERMEKTNLKKYGTPRNIPKCMLQENQKNKRERKAEKIFKKIVAEKVPSLLKTLIYMFRKLNELQVG